MNGITVRGLRVAIVGAALLSVVAVGTVAADSVYHTDQLALQPVGGAIGTGMVVNIHPNGPVNFAAERYALRGAEPNAEYTVWLIIDASDPALGCEDFDGLTIEMKAKLVTNAAGNGTSPADFVFAPGGIPPCLRGDSFPIRWEVTNGGTLTHLTEWTTVTLD